MKFLEVDIDHVSAEAIICMKNLLRKYPNVSDRIINGIGAFLKSVEEPEAKVALLWMISEYGHVKNHESNFLSDTTHPVSLLVHFPLPMGHGRSFLRAHI